MRILIFWDDTDRAHARLNHSEAFCGLSTSKATAEERQDSDLFLGRDDACKGCAVLLAGWLAKNVTEKAGISTRLTTYSAPDHSWLRVPLQDLAVLGIEDFISPFSFYDNQYAYLEEDRDMGVYTTLAGNAGYTLHITVKRVNVFRRDDLGTIPYISEASPAYWELVREHEIKAAGRVTSLLEKEGEK